MTATLLNTLQECVPMLFFCLRDSLIQLAPSATIARSLEHCSLANEVVIYIIKLSRVLFKYIKHVLSI